MKKIFALLILFISVKAFAQHPIGVDSFALQTLGNFNALVKSKAAIGSDSGFVNAHFIDTLAANRSKISHYPGAQIEVGDTLLIRNSTATGWNKVGGANGGVGGLQHVVGTDGVTNVNDSTIKLDTNYLKTIVYNKTSVDSSSAYKWDLRGNSINAASNFLGTTNNASLRFKTNNAEQMVLDSLGNLGIGTPNPKFHLHFVYNSGSTNSNSVAIESNTSDITASGVVFLKSRGTTPVPTAIANGDYIGGVGFQGYSGTGYLYNIIAGAKANGTVSSTSVPTDYFIAIDSAGIPNGNSYLDNAVKFVLTSKGVLGLGNMNISPDNSALLDMLSTTRGLLMPRMTTTQRDAIVSPATGLIVYNTTTVAFNFWNGSAWVAVGTGGGLGTVTNVSALTLGTSGTDLSSSVANSTTTPVITLNVPTASASNRGALSSTDWSTFNSKQAAISLTTTGTSGASTLVGSTLNIPQYSGLGLQLVADIPALENFSGSANTVRVTDTLRGGVFNYVASATPDSGIVFPANGKGSGFWRRDVNNISKYYATWFDVKGDSSTDNTATYILCLKALVNRGGGVLFFPKGFYKGNIVIPLIQSPSWVSITIQGEMQQVGVFGTVGTFTMLNRGTILQSNATGVTGLIYVFPNTGGTASNVILNVSDIEIRTYDNPQIDGVNAQYAQDLRMDNVFVNNGVYTTQSTLPTNLATGVITPIIGNGGLTFLKNVTVSGYYDGIKVGEHTEGQNTNILGCYNGLNFQYSSHTSHFTRACLQRNRNSIKVSGASYFTISNLDLEHADSATQTNSGNVWQLTKYDVNDSLNLGVGDISWHEQPGGSGTPYHTFLKNGGTGVRCTEIGSPAWALNTSGSIFNPNNSLGVATRVGIGNSAAGNLFSVGTPTTADATADAMIAASVTGQKALVIQAKASQVANPFEIQSSTGANLASVGLPNTTNSTIFNLNAPAANKEAGSFYWDNPVTTNAAYAAFGISTAGGWFGLTGYTLLASSKNGTGTQLPMSLGGYNGGWTHWLTISTAGLVGIGQAASSNTAWLHLKASTTAAASLRMPTGTAPTSPNEGDMWQITNDAHFYTNSTNYILAKTLQASATLDFASTAAQNSTDLTITVTGAALNDEVSVGAPNGAILSNSSFSGWVSATNTVTVRYNNYSSGSQDPASGTFRVSVIKH